MPQLDVQVGAAGRVLETFNGRARIRQLLYRLDFPAFVSSCQMPVLHEHCSVLTPSKQASKQLYSNQGIGCK